MKRALLCSSLVLLALLPAQVSAAACTDTVTLDGNWTGMGSTSFGAAIDGQGWAAGVSQGDVLTITWSYKLVQKGTGIDEITGECGNYISSTATIDGSYEAIMTSGGFYRCDFSYTATWADGQHEPATTEASRGEAEILGLPFHSWNCSLPGFLFQPLVNEGNRDEAFTDWFGQLTAYDVVPHEVIHCDPDCNVWDDLVRALASIINCDGACPGVDRPLVEAVFAGSYSRLTEATLPPTLGDIV